MARRSTRSPTGHTILAVDDQQDSLVSVRNLLEREGHRVLIAESGEQALAVVKTTEVDLMIVDYLMPRMNGAQLVRAVRSFDPFVQIILQTGYAGEEPPRVMLAELDIQGYHDKADDPERLLLWVDVALKAHRLLETLRERERAQTELVANCSHEFRTPVNIIAGYAELLLAHDFGELPAEAVRPVRSIEEAARTRSLSSSPSGSSTGRPRGRTGGSASGSRSPGDSRACSVATCRSRASRGQARRSRSCCRPRPRVWRRRHGRAW